MLFKLVLNLPQDPSFEPPHFTSGADDGKPQVLPDPIVAVDESLVYQPLVMAAFNIEKSDVSFSFQIKPDSNLTKPQYLIVGRYGFKQDTIAHKIDLAIIFYFVIRFIDPPDITKSNLPPGLMWSVVPSTNTIYGTGFSNLCYYKMF